MDAVVQWLLEGDPAIGWQVRRDLLDAPEKEWRAQQARVAEEGWGAQLLAMRGSDGLWAGGLYSPKWTSTTYTLLDLRQIGLSASDARATESVDRILEARIWVGRGQRAHYETCIAGFALNLACWFDGPNRSREALVSEVLAEQMPDGGWNCRRDRGAVHSSFHTTINVLEGLRSYAERKGPQTAAVEAAERRAQAFFCEHQIYRSHRTGAVVDAQMAKLSFPPRWHHDILRTLDYFQSARAARDERLRDPIERLLEKRTSKGTWNLEHQYSGKVWFHMERLGKPSRWNTLRALRILRWWESRA